MTTTLTDRQLILLETNAARDKAEALLHGLMQAKEEAERQLAEHEQRDPIKVVTGRSSIDSAISTTKRMIQTLNRRMAEARRDLLDEDMAILDEMSSDDDFLDGNGLAGNGTQR
ncbi:MAG: hypothetical protein KAS72_09175 [Phycisphaerales bacterium]|nr:hypothetical protein [Phycisphaerales bacterium]